MMSDHDLRVEVQWKLENFTCCWHENGNFLESAPFVVDSLRKTIWCLKIYPRGSLSSDSASMSSIGVFLSRQGNNNEGKLGLGSVDFEISILDSEMSPQRTRHICNYKFEEESENGWPNFINHKEICENREAFLPGDVLTLRCRIWKNKKGRFNKINAFLRTSIKIRSGTFKWKVENFGNTVSWSKKPVPVEVFPELISGNEDASVCLLYTANSNSEWLKVSISGQFLENWSWKCNIRFAQSSEFYLVCDSTVTSKDSTRDWLFKPVLNKKNVIDNKFLSNGVLFLDCYFCIVSHLPEQAIYYDEESNTLPNKSLSQVISNEQSSPYASNVYKDCSERMEFEAKDKIIRDSGTPKFQKLPEQVDEKFTKYARNSSTEEVPSNIIWHPAVEKLERQEATDSTLQQDIGRILNDRFQTDLVLKVDTEELHVHKLILAARSSVFRLMIEENQPHATDPTVTLEKIDVETTSKMVVYIYTDDPGHLNAEIALKLYYASVRFKLSGLKKICGAYLGKYLDVTNVCDVLELSESDGNENLRSEIVNFISDHEKEVILSDKWRELMKRNLKLTSEIMFSLFELKFENRKKSEFEIK